MSCPADDHETTSASYRISSSMRAVSLSPAAAGRFLVQWPLARRAVNFWGLVKVAGVDADLLDADLVRDLEMVLKNLPSGVLAEVKVASANFAGDAAPSPVTSMTVP